jgi:hypothetical protein
MLYVRQGEVEKLQHAGHSYIRQQEWVFTDGPGNCVEMFMPQKGVPRFNLTRKATGFGGD